MALPRPSVLLRLCAVAALVPLLGGCVALAVPALVGAGMLATNKPRTRAEVVAELPAANAAALAAFPSESGTTAVQLTGLTELPAPSFAAGPWQDFAAYTLDRAAGLAADDGNAQSALLTAEGVVRFQTLLRPCQRREPAVVIDLDPGEAAFTPAAAGNVAPGIAATVAQLREAGVIVLWVSQASANDVAGVAAALQTSGLDPSGRDPILLVRNADERKQVLREEANETVCVVAMAGDRRSDFDELFDYLRDPRLASVYDGQIGAGWFIVPPLFEAGSAVAPAGEDGGR